MDGANSIENKRPCKCDELIISIVYAQQFESLTAVLCNWHMPIVNETDLDSEEKKKKLPNEQEKIRFFLDSIGKLRKVN